MNSRPICTLEATELDDDLVLIPGHFLVGRNIKVPPQAAASQTKITNFRRWQLVQRLTQDFWHAWISCYLPSLQARSRWQKRQDNLAVGDIVFVKDSMLTDNNRWPLALVTATFSGTDKLVRAVDIKCGKKTYRRGVDRLIKLCLEDKQENSDPAVQSATATEYLRQCSFNIRWQRSHNYNISQKEFVWVYTKQRHDSTFRHLVTLFLHEPNHIHTLHPAW